MKTHLALAALSLLLLGAIPSTSPHLTKGPGAQPQQPAHAETPTEQHDASPSPIPAGHNNQPTASATTEHSETYVQNYYYYTEDSGNLPAWTQAGATIGLVLFALLQMYFMRRALLTDRPLVAVSDLRMEVKGDKTVEFRPMVEFQNCGRSPAIIKEVRMALGWWNRHISTVPPPPGRELSKAGVRHPIIASGDKIAVEYGVFLSDTPTALDIDAGNKRITIYGVMDYQAADGSRTYETRFYWVYAPQHALRGDFYLGPEEYNRRS